MQKIYIRRPIPRTRTPDPDPNSDPYPNPDPCCRSSIGSRSYHPNCCRSSQQIHHYGPVLPSSSETTTVEHQSALSPLRQSPSDQRTSDKVNSASDLVVPEQSRLFSSLSTPHPPRGSRRRPRSSTSGRTPQLHSCL